MNRQRLMEWGELFLSYVTVRNVVLASTVTVFLMLCSALIHNMNQATPSTHNIGKKTNVFDNRDSGVSGITMVAPVLAMEKGAAAATVRPDDGSTGGKSEADKKVESRGNSSSGPTGQRKVNSTKNEKSAVASRSQRDLVWPVSGRVISNYGIRNGRMHEGVDIGAPYGASVRAAAAGKVVRAGWFGGYGLCVDIAHGKGMVTRYAHLAKVKVRVGQNVGAGELVGNVGATGNASGPHLHFEVIINGVQQNPLRYY